jgi:hypothetical protein
MRQTFEDPKKSSSSISVRSNAKFPTKAVKGGCVGKGRSSLGGPETRSAKARKLIQKGHGIEVVGYTYAGKPKSRPSDHSDHEGGRHQSALRLDTKD